MPENWRELQSNQSARLCTFDITSTEMTVVYETADAVIEAPNWAPNGGYLVYNREGLLYRVAVDDGGQPEKIDTGAVRDANNDHVLSPDGQFVYISANNGHLYEVAVTGGTPRRVSNTHAEAFRHFLHGISPDGKTLAYTGAQEANGNAFGLLNIFTVPAAGGEDKQLTDSDKASDGPEFSPDGDWIYFNSEMGSTVPGHAQIFRMRADGADVTQLTHDERVNWFPHLSPDGSLILYISYAPGTTGHPANRDVIVRTMGPRGGGTKDLFHVFGGQGTINVNSWSPDGRRFAYVDYPIPAKGH
jgi:TolB protein